MVARESAEEPEARPPRAPRPRRRPRAAKPEREPRPERERSQKPQRTDRHPQRDVSDAPNSHSFHEGNMPAFLMRSVKVG